MDGMRAPKNEAKNPAIPTGGAPSMLADGKWAKVKNSRGCSYHTVHFPLQFDAMKGAGARLCSSAPHSPSRWQRSVSWRGRKWRCVGHLIYANAPSN